MIAENESGGTRELRIVVSNHAKTDTVVASAEGCEPEPDAQAVQATAGTESKGATSPDEFTSRQTAELSVHSASRANELRQRARALLQR
jgi:hypothetical protein